jgi:hypothetical protein
MRNSTAGAAPSGGQERRISGKANKNGTSRRAQIRLDFGGCFAYKDQAAHPGKLSEGEQHGQEDLEEVEEDPSNQAADGAWVRQEVGPQFHGPGRAPRWRALGLERFLVASGAAARTAAALFACAAILSLPEPALSAFPPFVPGVKEWNFAARVLKFSTGVD